MDQFSKDNYSLVPIRDQDKYEIMNWRNAQISILRQQATLTKEQQDNYFKTTVAQLFEQEKPEQLLWSFLLNKKLIGYGGLVHINWTNKTAEISFLTETSRNASKEVFVSDWVNYLSILKTIAQDQLHFHSIYTYAYDIRPNLYVALEKAGFKETTRLKDHVEIDGKLKDAVTHTFYFDALTMRTATANDVDLYFNWANDKVVRENSFDSSEINYEQHVKWFNTKLNSKDCFFYLFTDANNKTVGQVRIDKTNEEVVIGVSIDANYRGKGFGKQMLDMASKAYFKQFPEATIIAYVKEVNTASIKLFKSAGFIKMGTLKVGTDNSIKFQKNKK